jgi:hypothetical protein
MADTVLRQRDLNAFVDFCRNLPADACGLLVTPYVDDEKPLWVEVDEGGMVQRFGSQSSGLVTSGMYFLQPQAMEIAEEMLASGTQKMRGFLAGLGDRKIPIKTFVVSKTIDVDHPSDLEKAAAFLHSD